MVFAGGGFKGHTSRLIRDPGKAGGLPDFAKSWFKTAPRIIAGEARHGEHEPCLSGYRPDEIETGMKSAHAPRPLTDKSLERVVIQEAMSRTRTIQIAALASILELGCWSQPVKPGPQPEDPSVSLESLPQTRLVTASHFPEDLTEAPGVMTVLQRSDLERWGGLTLREILNRVSGLSIVSKTFSDRSIVSVRGEQAKDNGSHVLFPIDRRPTREVLEGGVMTELLESFPVSLPAWAGAGCDLWPINARHGCLAGPGFADWIQLLSQPAEQQHRGSENGNAGLCHRFFPISKRQRIAVRRRAVGSEAVRNDSPDGGSPGVVSDQSQCHEARNQDAHSRLRGPRRG